MTNKTRPIWSLIHIPESKMTKYSHVDSIPWFQDFSTKEIDSQWKTKNIKSYLRETISFLWMNTEKITGIITVLVTILLISK